MAQFVVPRSIPMLNFGPGIFSAMSGKAASHDRLAVEKLQRQPVGVPEGQHDGSLARSAWKNGSGKIRPVGYGLRRPLRNGNFADPHYTCGRGSGRFQSHRTLQDGSFGLRNSRHFVPGYHRLVPPGQNLCFFDNLLGRSPVGYHDS
jgi:hypothetical protein